MPRKAEKNGRHGYRPDHQQAAESVDEVFGRIDPQRMAEEMRGPITAIVPSLIHETMEEIRTAHLGKPAAAGTRTGGAQGDEEVPNVIGGIIEEIPPASGRGAGFAPDGDRRLQARSRPTGPHFPDGRQTREFRFIELSGLIFGIRSACCRCSSGSSSSRGGS